MKSINPYEIIDLYYPESNQLKHILLTHSRLVAQKAISIADRHPEIPVDKAFMEEAALLHDIGIFKTHAPAIDCMGTEPYICHGLIGGRLLRDAGFPRHARICERHTGTGLTRQTIRNQQLPLPDDVDLVPETEEEQIICFADKFFSKTHPEDEKTVEQALRSLNKFGPEGIEKFHLWIKKYL